MNNYGFIIKPESFKDGSNIVFANATSINYLQDINVPYVYNYMQANSDSISEYKFQVNKRPDSSLLIVPTSIGGYVRGGWLYYPYNILSVIKEISVTNNQIIVRTLNEASTTSKDKGKIIATLRVYEILPPSQDLNPYGVMFKNSLDFTKITDYSTVGLIVYKDKHRLSGELDLSEHIINSSSYLVYADWESEKSVVEFDYVNHKLIVTGDEVDIDVIIVNSNIPIQAPDKYGMVMKSAISGDITYSSRYAAVPINTLVNFNGGSGTLPFDKNYISLGRYGLYSIKISNARSDVYYGGLVKYGKSIKSSKGSYKGQMNDRPLPSSSHYTNISLLAIDGGLFNNN